MAKFSVIVPIYNVEKYLNRCMNSILNQTLNDIEVILVDDGSPDGCPEMCDNYAKQDARVKVIHKKNGGLGLARNSGLQIASGEFVAFVDSDDYVAADTFEKMYLRLRETKADCCVVSYVNKMDSGDEIPKINPLGDCVLQGTEILDTLLLGMLGAKPDYERDTYIGMSVWKCAFKKEIIKENKILFPSEREYISEDIVFQMMTLPKVKKACIMTDLCYYYCENRDSVSLTKKYDENKFYRYKKLYLKELNALDQLDILKEGKYRAARMFMGNIRVCLKQIAANEALDASKKKELIQQICTETEVKEIIRWYPWNKNPWKQRIATVMIKYGFVNLIQIVFK